MKQVVMLMLAGSRDITGLIARQGASAATTAFCGEGQILGVTIRPGELRGDFS